MTPALASHAKLIASVDSFPEINGAGIVLIGANGVQIQVRGGPRRQWVWIAPSGMVSPVASSSAAEDLPQPAGFWDRWGNSVLSCSSAVAAGAVIALSAGTTTVVAGMFAANSAVLCLSSLGQAIADDAWNEFERTGGTAYKTWLTVETTLSLLDLCYGIKGAATLLKSWQQAGKLARLEKAVARRNLTRADLLRVMREIDPTVDATLHGGSYISKAKLLGISEDLLQKGGFKSLNNHRARVIVDGLGNAATVGGTPYAVSAFKRTWDVWVVVFQ